MLGKYECLHRYPVPSTMSSSMRQALYPSGAKDDPRDADLLLDLLLQNRDKLRRLTPDNEATRRGQNPGGGRPQGGGGKERAAESPGPGVGGGHSAGG